MAKQYLYKVSVSGQVYDTLDNAINSTVDSMRERHMNVKYTSRPYVVKSFGGYDVHFFTYSGRVYKYHIDVFIPSQYKGTKKTYILDNISRENPLCCWENGTNREDYDTFQGKLRGSMKDLNDFCDGVDFQEEDEEEDEEEEEDFYEDDENCTECKCSDCALANNCLAYREYGD
jgi:hypothetical protein